MPKDNEGIATKMNDKSLRIKIIAFSDGSYQLASYNGESQFAKNDQELKEKRIEMYERDKLKQDSKHD